MSTNDPSTQTAVDILGPTPDHYNAERAIALFDIVSNKSRSTFTRADALDELLMSWAPPAQRDDIGQHVREQLAKQRAADEAAKAKHEKAQAEVEASKAAIAVALAEPMPDPAAPSSDEPEITITADEPAPASEPPALASLLAEPPKAS